jgi:chemotaxis protein methyltransferase CheR
MAGTNPTDVKILATDISTRVLKTAARGIYEGERLKALPRELIRKHFLKGQGSWEGCYRVKDDLMAMVEFRRLNLKNPFPPSDPFDVIFCRNVMIYFDRGMQTSVVNRFYDALKDGGYLFIGHSESLTGISHRFKYIEPSVYRK